MKAIRPFDRVIAPAVALVTLFVSLAIVRVGGQEAPDLRNLPNIIIFRCNGLGYGDLSCYGQTNFLTPNIDQMASEGVRFTGFHPEGPDFSTALAALMTGKEPANAPNFISLAQRMHNLGYHTGLIGEWTLGSRPQEQGFDEFGGFVDDMAGRNYFADHVWRFGHQMVFTNGVMEDYFGNEEIYDNTAGKKGKYMPEVFANAVVNFMTINHPQAYKYYQPFFLVVNLPAPRSASASADEFPVPSDAPYSDQPWPQAAKDRASLLTRIDAMVGRLVGTFQTLKITNNVVMFFTSSAPPEKFANRQMDFLKPNGGYGWNEAPAPMIAYGPQWVSPGRVCDTNWTGVDLGATVLQLAGERRQPADVPGKSIAAAVMGR